MPDPIDLTDCWHAPSADRLYLHTAAAEIAEIKERLGWSEVDAITMLPSAFHTGLIRTWELSFTGDCERCSPARWRGAETRGRGAIKFFLGGHHLVQRFLISRDDFSIWLEDQVRLDNQARTPSELVTTTRGKGGRPRRHDRDEFHREVIRIADSPDGLPDDQQELTRTMRDWCAKWSDPPDDRTIRDRVSAIYAYRRSNRS